MEFTAIEGITGNQDLWSTGFDNSFFTPVEQPKEGTAAFIDIFTSAIENVKTTDEEKNQMEYLLAVGELDNPAQLTIAAAKAQTAVDLLIQLRNKALEVHSEISKFPV